MQGLYNLTPSCSYIREICYNDFTPQARTLPQKKALKPAPAAENMIAAVPSAIDATSRRRVSENVHCLTPDALKEGQTAGRPIGGLPLAFILWRYYINDEI